MVWCTVLATSISLCMIIPALQAWARVAAAKKEALIKSTIERMMRLSVSKTIRYCWSQWCRYMRRTLAETVRRLHAERLDAERRFQELESKYQAQHGHDAANLQHEISAMLALHEHTCKARIDARQMSEAAVDRQVELDLAVARQRYETDLAELSHTNKRLRTALLSSLAEAAGNLRGLIGSILLSPLRFLLRGALLSTALSRLVCLTDVT